MIARLVLTASCALSILAGAMLPTTAVAAKAPSAAVQIARLKAENARLKQGNAKLTKDLKAANTRAASLGNQLASALASLTAMTTQRDVAIGDAAVRAADRDGFKSERDFARAERDARQAEIDAAKTLLGSTGTLAERIDTLRDLIDPSTSYSLDVTLQQLGSRLWNGPASSSFGYKVNAFNSASPYLMRIETYLDLFSYDGVGGEQVRVVEGSYGSLSELVSQYYSASGA